LFPQHSTVPAESRAQLCEAPRATAVAPVMPVTATGVLESVFKPLPQLTVGIESQHSTVPSESNAHVW